MTTSPLALIDSKLDPMLQAANRIRQVRDSLPPHFWTLMPELFREPVEALFLGVESWDRFVGQMKEAGLITEKDLTPGE